MVLSWSLRAILLCLFSPCLRGTEAQQVDQNTLARIVRVLQERYHPEKIGAQFVVAINIPAYQCGPGYVPREDFLPNEDPQVVRADFEQRRIYKGSRMIGAVPNKSFHSEYWLLRHPDQQNLPNPPMLNLLEKYTQGCVIFYTYNSPCDQTCLNPGNTHNILTAIRMFSRHRGPKAFVYNEVFMHKPEGLVKQGKAINDNVALYRCHPNPETYECHYCIQQNQIVPQCLN